MANQNDYVDGKAVNFEMSDHEVSSLKESCEQSIKELDDNELITINVLNA